MTLHKARALPAVRPRDYAAVLPPSTSQVAPVT
jgi:hypothetical protein